MDPPCAYCQLVTGKQRGENMLYHLLKNKVRACDKCEVAIMMVISNSDCRNESVCAVVGDIVYAMYESMRVIKTKLQCGDGKK